MAVMPGVSALLLPLLLSTKVLEPAPAAPSAVIPAGASEQVDLGLSYREGSRTHLRIHRSGATFIKIRFKRLKLAAGDFVSIRDPAGRERHVYYGDPRLSPHPKNSAYTVDHEGSGHLWALSIEGPTAIVELHHSDRASSTPGAADHGVEIDRITRGYSTAELGSQPAYDCVLSEFLSTSCYEHGAPEMTDRARAVARLLLNNGGGLCTAFRIGSGNHFLTSGHCLADQADVDAVEIQFGERLHACGSDELTVPDKIPGQDLVEAWTQSSLNFALFTAPSDQLKPEYGHLRPGDRPLEVGEELYIVHHASRFGQQVSERLLYTGRGKCRTLQVGNDVEFFCDTDAGASGAAVLRAEDHQLVALHQSSNCLEDLGHGLSFDHIWSHVADHVPTQGLQLDSPRSDAVLTRGQIYEFRWRATDLDSISVKAIDNLGQSTVIFDKLAATPTATELYWQLPGDWPLGPGHHFEITGAQDGGPTVTIKRTFSTEAPVEYTGSWPYVEDFETFPDGLDLAAGWRQSPSDRGQWTTVRGPAEIAPDEEPFVTGPDVDHTNGTAQGAYLLADAALSQSPNKSMWVLTPRFDLRSFHAPEVQFWLHMFSDYEKGQPMGDLSVEISVDDGPWSELLQVQGDQGDAWQRHRLDLSEASGHRARLRWVARTGSGWASDMAIDDVIVHERPSLLHTEVEVEAGEDRVHRIVIRDDRPDAVEVKVGDAPDFVRYAGGTLDIAARDKDIGTHEVKLQLDDGLVPTPIEATLTIRVNPGPETTTTTAEAGDDGGMGDEVADSTAGDNESDPPGATGEPSNPASNDSTTEDGCQTSATRRVGARGVLRGLIGI